MSTNEIVFKEIKLGGLGTVISSVSAMVSIKNPVVWKVDGTTESERALLQYVIDCYDVPKDNFRFEFTDSPLGDRVDITDIGKFFSPYITSDRIIYHDKSFPIRTEDVKKPCVGLALYDKRKTVNDPNHGAFTQAEFKKKQQSWPERKMWPLETNLKIINLLLSAGYDLISLDSNALRLDDKIYMLTEHCDFVIGYEGGLHHLAHTLNIPSIVLPWSYPYPHDYNDSFIHDSFIHALHLDKKTWIAPTIEDVLNLTPQSLDELRNQLAAGHGNNMILNNKVGFSKDFQQIRIHNGDKKTFKQYCWQFFTPHTYNIISNITDKRIGGIQEFYYF